MQRVGIVGAGLIGAKRASQMKGGRLIAVCDQDAGRAEKLASQYGAAVEKTWLSLVKRPDIDSVIISVTHDALSACSLAALENGKHVLVEKPAGRYPDEVSVQIKMAQKTRKILRVGFNHRFHPGFQQIKRQITQGDIGPLMYIRARYGHGGRLGYEKEWRADPKISGGGELIDQGVHLIDLCNWLGGPFELEWGKAINVFWKMPVEDNGFMALKSADGQRSAFLHASCTEWKNLFDFEIFGQTGKLEIWGLGRSYGTEELRFYKMKPEMGPPDTKITPFPDTDQSWQAEFDAFLSELEGRTSDIAKPEDALRALQIVSDVYKRSGFPAPAKPCSV